ncbi:MAG: hypothetical protein IPN29_21965 [Saprospiraceae bacterium]|nr:hypothetical protein [Saprospiraceae bacterium]
MNVTQTGFRVKDVLAYAAVLAMFVGLVLSRTVYSIGLLFIAIYWITDVRISLSLWKKPWFLSMLAMALVALVVDVIQGAGVDKVFFIKLSLPLFPLFFHFSTRCEKIDLPGLCGHGRALCHGVSIPLAILCKF